MPARVAAGAPRVGVTGCLRFFLEALQAVVVHHVVAVARAPLLAWPAAGVHCAAPRDPLRADAAFHLDSANHAFVADVGTVVVPAEGIPGWKCRVRPGTW